MSKFPDHLYNEWHPTKNEKPLDEYALYSKYQAYWICSEKPHHEWQSRLAHRYGKNGLNGTGCPYCANKILLVGENDLASQYPQLVKEWSPKNLVKPNEVVFGYSKKVIWICNKAHEWEDTVSNRTLLGRGCPYCNGAKPIVGKNDLATLHPELVKEWSSKNNFKPQDVLIKSNRKPIWVCNKGHEWQTSVAHRTGKNHTGCPYCTNQKVIAGFNDFTSSEEWTKLSKEWSRKNKIKPTELTIGSDKKVIWKCINKHEWEVTISARLRGYGCPYCANKFLFEGFNDLATTHPELAKEWSAKNELSPNKVIGAKDEKVWWKCSQGHEWEQAISARKGGRGCPICNLITSTPERDIEKFLEQFDFKVKRNDRKVLKGLELDFYIPEKNIAVEFNGLYWHTEARGKGQKYHYDKWLKCKEQGIQLIQIWEDDWNRNPEQIKNMLKNKLGVSSQESVYARKTSIVNLTVQQSQDFMKVNHIQGWTIGSYYIGLQDKTTSEIVAVCIVKKEPKTEGRTLNIMRYATGKKVPGGFTKILSYVEKAYKPERIITFSDNTISDGNLYASNGFYADKEIPPDYQYYVKGERKHKFGYRLKRFETDPELKWVSGYTETQLAKLNNIERIWDAGKTRWVKDLNKDF